MRTQLPPVVKRYAAPTVAVAATAAAVGLLVTGGSANAGSLVTSADIKDQTIRSVDIGRGGVGTSEIRNQSIRSGDVIADGVGQSEIRAGAVHGSEVADGAIGYDKLDPALQAEVDTGYDVGDHMQHLGPAGPYTITMACADYGDADKVAVSGGVRYDSAGGDETKLVVNASYPDNLVDAEDGVRQAKSWTVSITTAADSMTVRTFVVCQNPG